MRGTGGMVGAYASSMLCQTGHMGTNGWTLSGQDGISATAIAGPMGMTAWWVVEIWAQGGSHWERAQTGCSWASFAFSPPRAGGERVYHFLSTFVGLAAPSSGILSGVAGCVQRLLQHILAKLSPLLIDIGSSFQLNQFLVAKKYFGF